MPGLRRNLRGSILVLFLLTNCLLAANLSEPATNLARLVSGTTGPGVITLAFANTSSLPKSDEIEVRRNFESQLRAAGVRIGSAADAHSDVRVTLSENLQDYVWVAEIKEGSETKVQMVSFPRTTAAQTSKTQPNVTIRATLLWSQSTPILDAYVDGNRMVLLDVASISNFSLKSGKWELEQSAELIHLHNFPRDPRGLLVPAKDHLADAYLPGTVCAINAQNSFSATCRDGDDPWPLESKSALFNSGRNYFTGALFPASIHSTAPFYSMAELSRQTYTLALFTGTDGRVRMNDGTHETVASSSTFSDWGSDIASVRSACGGGTQILVTGTGDDTASDSLRAFEIPDREPIQVSAATEFPGPITSLWTHGGNTATAVVHNLRTGSYEAYSITVTCGL
jgi:hypothetical protein